MATAEVINTANTTDTFKYTWEVPADFVDYIDGIVSDLPSNLATRVGRNMAFSYCEGQKALTERISTTSGTIVKEVKDELSPETRTKILADGFVIESAARLALSKALGTEKGGE
jgi:hypothetical protein